MDFTNPDAIRQAFRHMEQRIDGLEAQLATANQQRAAFETQLAAVNQQLATANQQLAQVTRVPAPATPRPRAVLPDPEKFGGSRYHTWLPLIKAKLDIDSEAIGGSDKAHFWYVYGNLEDKIQALVLPLAKELRPQPSMIFDSLARIYADPNKASRAANRLTQLRQGTATLPHYLAKFERTLVEAEALDWPDSAKVTALRSGLCATLKEKLEAQLAVPTGYADFVEALHQLSGHAPPANVSTHHDKMDIGNIEARSTRARWEAMSDTDED